MVEMEVYDDAVCYDEFKFEKDIHESLMCAWDPPKKRYSFRDPGSPLVTLVGGTNDTYELIGVDIGDPGNPRFSR